MASYAHRPPEVVAARRRTTRKFLDFILCTRSPSLATSPIEQRSPSTEQYLLSQRGVNDSARYVHGIIFSCKVAFDVVTCILEGQTQFLNLHNRKYYGKHTLKAVPSLRRQIRLTLVLSVPSSGTRERLALEKPWGTSIYSYSHEKYYLYRVS